MKKAISGGKRLATASALTLCLGFLLLFQPAPASAAGFPFLCRGQMLGVQSVLAGDSFSIPSQVETVTYKIRIKFRVNPTAAGDAGANLNAGACAWVDRPTSPAEGTVITLSFTYSAYPPNIEILTQCSVTTDCVFRITADRPEGSDLQGYAHDIVIYPDAPKS
jgi:hypothetical protein